jgi:nucleoside-diphosphate-sugar epimerase
MKNSLAPDLDQIVARTAALWEELREKRIFITGGTGFFGSWLLESLLHANHQLGLRAKALVLTRDPKAFRDRLPHLCTDAVEFHMGDIRDFEFPAGEFSHIIHAATPASARINTEEPLQMLDITVQGTRRVLEFSRRCGARKFLLTSSGAIYGRQPGSVTHVQEDFAGAPMPEDINSAYAHGKRMAEHLCAQFSHQYGFETKIARCFAFVGPYLALDIHYAIGNFIRDGLRGAPIQVGGDGTPFRSYQYTSDLCVWLWTILFRGVPGRPYNVGSDQDLSIGDLARMLATICGTEAKVAKTPVPGAIPERYVPNIQRAQKELGLTNAVSLTEAVERTLAWHRKRM